jgi:hypothetical protein
VKCGVREEEKRELKVREEEIDEGSMKEERKERAVRARSNKTGMYI